MLSHNQFFNTYLFRNELVFSNLVFSLADLTLLSRFHLFKPIQNQTESSLKTL
jgi:hypothetical protein